MIHRPPQAGRGPRRAATLIEVLVAIFIMGIGLIAILSLFPLGAIRMSAAIQDDRCAYAAANGHALAMAHRPWEDGDMWYGVYPLPLPPANDPTRNNPLERNPTNDGSVPSYPVYIDPMGCLLVGPMDPRSSVGGASGTIPRRTVSYVTKRGGTQTYHALRWFAGLDDIFFNTDGLPNEVPPGSRLFEREVRYSHAYMVRRPQASDATLVDLTVVVYNRRPLQLTAGLGLDETRFRTNANTNEQVLYYPSRNTVYVKYAGAPPAVRPGEWVLDDTGPPDDPTGYVHAFFNRVVAVNEISNNEVELELQNPIRGFYGWGTEPYQGSMVVLDGVAEVFEKGLVGQR